jgi:hypothetical protein
MGHPMRGVRWTALLALIIGCAHGSLEGGVLHKGGLRIEVGPVPATWRRVELDGADLAFRDDVSGGSALFAVRCGRRDDDAPLAILTEHLIMGTTDRETLGQEVIPFDRREAMRTLLLAKLDGVPMQYDIYVVKKDGCVYDLVYVAPPERFAAGAAEFERFAGGVHSAPTRLSAEAPSGSKEDP